MTFKGNQRAHGRAELLQLRHAAEFGDVDDKHGRDHFDAGAAQASPRLPLPRLGVEIADRHNAFALNQRVGAHFHFVDAVFRLKATEMVACDSLPLLWIRGSRPRAVPDSASENEAAPSRLALLLNLATV